MSTPLLQTKLYIPPVRPELVPRPRLIERLNAGLHRKLTLVSAPAGFGKTTLVSDWLRQLGVSAAWVSLDKGDNDPARFLTYLVAALQTIEAGIGVGALGALQMPQSPPTEAILTGLINEIAAIPDRIVLVLDDYHLVEAQPIHSALTFILQHLPPQTHLVITTREDPPMPLARLRARGQLTELRATDLRFSSSEVAEFLNTRVGLDLSAEDVAALEGRTEGWIAGLQLAAISMQERKDATSFIQSFTGSHRFVLDYLVEEVLEQQSERVQTFLLQTAILDRLTGPLCDALTGEDNGRATLETLLHTNLFIVPLDEERRWYRYHHLFDGLLRHRLLHKHPGWMPTLHIRASEWYEQNEFIDQAIEHALLGEDFERAARLIESAAEAVWVRGDDIKLRRWLDGLPSELMFSRPQLCVFHAWSLFATGQQDAAERCLKVGEETLDPSLAPSPSEGSDRAAETVPIEQDRLSGSGGKKLRGRVAATRAFFAFYRGDVPGITQYARQALEYLPRQDAPWRSVATGVLGDALDFRGEMAAAYQARLEALEASKAAGNSYQIMIANLKLAIILRHQGRLQRVIEICQQQLQLAHESGMAQTVVVGWLLAIWGEVLAELNDLDGAVRQARKGVELTERGGDVAMLGWSYVCLTRVLFARGDMTGAEEIVQKMENAAREYHVPPWITNLMAAWRVRIWLAEDKLDAVSQWAQERGLTVAGDLEYLREMEYVVLARLLIVQGRLDESVKLLQRLLETVEPRGHTVREVEILNLQALAFQAKGDPVQAMIPLERALTLAEPGGLIRTFVDEGPPMARLLERLRRKDALVDYIARILAAFEDATEDEERTTMDRELAGSSVVHRASSALVEPLSERELEVLGLIAEGLTNPEIASRLYLSVNTVKVHTRNIYGKLNVQRRTQAIARSQELGLLTRR